MAERSIYRHRDLDVTYHICRSHCSLRPCLTFCMHYMDERGTAARRTKVEDVMLWEFRSSKGYLSGVTLDWRTERIAKRSSVFGPLALNRPGSDGARVFEIKMITNSFRPETFAITVHLESVPMLMTALGSIRL